MAESVNTYSTVDELLIEEVRKYPWLYNMQRQDYKDCGKKDNSRKEITSNLQKYDSTMTKESLQLRWKTLREKFARERRFYTPSGSGASARRKWYLYDTMSFLTPFIRHKRKAFQNISLKRNETAVDEEANCSPLFMLEQQACDSPVFDQALPLIAKNRDQPAEADSLSFDGEHFAMPVEDHSWPQLLEQQPVQMQPRAQSNSECQEHSSSTLPRAAEHNFPLHNQIPTSSASKRKVPLKKNAKSKFENSMDSEILTTLQSMTGEDEDDHFALSMVATLKRLPAITRAELKLEISQLILGAEIKELKKQKDNE